MDLEKLFHIHKYGDRWLNEWELTKSLKKFRQMNEAFGIYPGSQASIDLSGGVLTPEMIQEASDLAVKSYGK